MTSLTSHILNQQYDEVNFAIAKIFWRRGGDSNPR